MYIVMKNKLSLKEKLDIGIQVSLEAKELGLTLNEFLIYGVIGIEKINNVNQIAQYANMNRTTVSKCMVSLLEKGFIKKNKKINVTDKRFTYYKAIRKVG